MTVIRQLHNQLVGGLQAADCSGKIYRKVSALCPNGQTKHLPGLPTILNAAKGSCHSYETKIFREQGFATAIKESVLSTSHF